MDDDDDEEDGKAANPMAAAKDMKDALATGGVDKMASIGVKQAANVTGMLGKGMGSLTSKAFSLW